MAPEKEKPAVNPGFLNLWVATKRRVMGTSDDYQITTEERAASKTDQSDSVSELEEFKKIGCQ